MKDEWISPAQRSDAIEAEFLRLYEWRCKHSVELREERSGRLECARCAKPVLPRGG